ncbi:LOW QUALITY PROTEIN: hypothetical protein TorRG33x02_256610 [Trema orientale]|uniref:Uncharacterized protein n=1 Tax=Trema orientale TaxID=63057 RepID=A0A2P5DB40_TREOI|nr:LOW QUALITY PROTEIN: hypothetical protein TorRG33x02_256610 [Trema orientale]
MYWTVDDAVGIYSTTVLVKARLTGGYESARAAEMWTPPPASRITLSIHVSIIGAPHLLSKFSPPPHTYRRFERERESSYDSAVVSLSSPPPPPPTLTVVLRDKRERARTTALLSACLHRRQSRASFPFLSFPSRALGMGLGPFNPSLV